MSKIKNKRILKEIAKRFAKTILIQTECQEAFDGGNLLTVDEVHYIEECVCEIAERITDLPLSYDTELLVREYFKFEEE